MISSPQPLDLEGRLSRRVIETAFLERRNVHRRSRPIRQSFPSHRPQVWRTWMEGVFMVRVRGGGTGFHWEEGLETTEEACSSLLMLSEVSQMINLDNGALSYREIRRQYAV